MVFYAALGLGLFSRRCWNHRSHQEKSLVRSIRRVLSQLEIWRYAKDSCCCLPRLQFLTDLVDIANDIMHMVGLDGGLIPGDGDASSKSNQTTFLPTQDRLLIGKPIR